MKRKRIVTICGITLDVTRIISIFAKFDENEKFVSASIALDVPREGFIVYGLGQYADWVNAWESYYDTTSARDSKGRFTRKESTERQAG